MTSNDKHFQLVESMKNAEKAQDGKDCLLFELVSSAIEDASPTYDLREIHEALTESRAWLLLDPLNVLPLLISSDKDFASELIHVVSREGSAKESLMAVQEALERLRGPLNTDNQENETSFSSRTSELVQLIGIYETTLPRLKLRTKGPLETLRPIIDHLSEVIDAMAPHSPRETGRDIVLSICRLIKVTAPWLSQNAAGTRGSQHMAVLELFTNLLYSALSACVSHIHASLAQRQFETFYPRLVIRSSIFPDSERGIEVMKEAVITSQFLGLTFESFAKPPVNISRLILLAHGYCTSHPISLSHLYNLSPVMIFCIEQNTAIDESLALLLTFLSSSKDSLPQELVDSFVALLIPLAASHPDAPTRHLVFRTLSLVLSHAPPLVHLAHLSSLLADCPFQQMRVAAVGLVKEAFLNAINADDKSPFLSPSLIHTLGPTIFRPNPPDLFSKTTEDSIKHFLRSSEPSRLTECLVFYYVLLKRDIRNSTGIKDRDVLRTVENGLLAPLRMILATWLSDASSVEDVQTLAALASLKTSLERVDGALLSINNSGPNGDGK